MGARTLVSFEQFEKFPDDGMKHELLQGEHLVEPPPIVRQTEIRQTLFDSLRPHVHEHRLGEVHIEAGFKLSSATWLQPDVSFVRTAQIQRVDRNGYYDGAPAIAIEVASDSNTAAQLDLKMELYFAHGAEEVWVVYPKTKKTIAHYPDGHSQTFTTDLRSDLFPDWSLSVSSLLQD
jgi:Uma2 family endonuclease